MIKHYTLFLLFITSLQGFMAQAQDIKGLVKGRVYSQNEPVPFANVAFEGTTKGTSTDEQGKFIIENVAPGTYRLVVTAVGYESVGKNIVVKGADATVVNIGLKENNSELEEVVVTGTLKEVSKLNSPVPVEIYTPAYFQKNPTPALFEALQIVNGVRPQLNCAVCNTGDIHINGMEGAYTMILIDGMPIVGGLSTVYGLNGIPTSMVERIEVVKGPASTLYGSEAVGGLINVITKTPGKAPLVSADVFGTSWSELNVDLGLKARVGKATSLMGVNYFNYTNPIDNNGDNFTDVTLQNRISLFNKWNFERKHSRVASLAARYVYEDRWGGEMQWTKAFRGGDEIYGESIYTARYELIGAYQLPIHTEKLLLSFSASSHNQNSVYGNVPYLANQKIGFGQLIWDKKISPIHDALFGVAMRYTYYDDNTPATRTSDEFNPGNKSSNTYLPGIFVQDEITLSASSRLLAGLRYDYNSNHGHVLSPRLNYKWTPNPNNILRLSVGNGFRVVNLFTEDHAATTGSRNVIITEELKPERSWNANLNYQKFINTDFGVISLDGSAFYTYFTNKIVADYLTNDDQIIYDNINGHAVSRGLSLSSEFTFTFPLKINAGATLMEVYQVEEDELGQLAKSRQLLTENISGTFTASYTLSKLAITIDYTGNVYGPMKLPIVENDFRSEYSSTYSLQNIQITKKFKNGMELYGGVKNLLNFRPPANSMLRSFDPFDRTVDDPVTNPNGYTFDPAYVYAPNQGIRGFLGIRYNLFK
jgi:outer membrane receptor for ferrienterochelin and colicins